jgi:hypothetical protein
VNELWQGNNNSKTEAGVPAVVTGRKLLHCRGGYAYLSEGHTIELQLKHE